MDWSDAIRKYITKRSNAGVADFAPLGLSRPVLFRTNAAGGSGAHRACAPGRLSTRNGSGDASDNWAQVMHRYPQGVLFLLSALAFH